MDIVKVFGSNVKRYRQQTGLSQEAFAEKCGMHRTYISAIECFRRSISLENIQRIADALGVEPYKLRKKTLPTYTLILTANLIFGWMVLGLRLKRVEQIVQKVVEV